MRSEIKAAIFISMKACTFPTALESPLEQKTPHTIFTIFLLFYQILVATKLGNKKS